jgi:hypothetical protein
MSAASEGATAPAPEAGRPSAVAGAFPDPESAERGVRALQSAGFARDLLGLVMRRRDDGVGRAGGVLGSLVSAEVITLPDIGAVIAGGTMVDPLRTGVGVAEALVEFGVPEADARRAAERFAAGDAILSASAGPRVIEAVVLLQENGADVGSLAELATTNPNEWNGVDRRASGRAGRRQTDTRIGARKP